MWSIDSAGEECSADMRAAGYQKRAKRGSLTGPASWQDLLGPAIRTDNGVVRNPSRPTMYTQGRFASLVNVLVLLTAATAASCHRAADPGRVRQLLTVFSGASDVIEDRNTIAYNIDERYPATEKINELNRNLEGNGCAMTKADPFNPEPGLPFNKWMEYTPAGGGVPELLWTGAWQCKPSDDVVVFALRTRRPTANGPTPALAVKGAYYPGEQVVAMRKYVAGSGSRSLLFGTERRTATRSVSYETCSTCGSVRKKENDKDWVVVYDAPSEPHDHHWESGVSTGAKIADGQVIPHHNLFSMMVNWRRKMSRSISGFSPASVL